MLDFTGLAAVQFSDGGKLFLRVFYQDGCLVKESCYDTENGWYTMPGDIVANDARLNSPIGATNWQGGKETRVYYLNEDGKLCQRHRSTGVAGEEGTWQNAADFPSYTPATYTKLAATRSNDSGANIRLYYQNTDNTIKQLMFDNRNKNWRKEKDIGIQDAKPGTNLAAVSGGDEVRLFYQNTANYIKMQYTTPNIDWTRGKIGDYQVASLASLSAVSWGYGTNLKIELFSLNADNTAVLQMSFSQGDGGWDDEQTDTKQPVLNSQGQNSAMAAIRIPGDGSISVFYQPERKIIGLYTTTVKRVPLGIPTTGLTKVERQREEALAKQRQETAARLIQEEEQKKQTKLKNMGVCPSGFAWVKEAGGYRCSAGGHFITDAQLA